MRAYCLIREQPWYRREAFTKGLKAAGYTLDSSPPKGRPGDVLLQWNRYWGGHDQATRFEAEGGVVLVAENGYLNADGSSPKFAVHPHGPKPTDYYAIGLGFHNDHTRVMAGESHGLVGCGRGGRRATISWYVPTGHSGFRVG